MDVFNYLPPKGVGFEMPLWLAGLSVHRIFHPWQRTAFFAKGLPGECGRWLDEFVHRRVTWRPQ